MSVQSGGLLFDLVSDAVIVLDVHDCGLDARVHAELAQHRFYMQLDGAVGDAEVACDHLVTLTLGHQLENFAFAPGQFTDHSGTYSTSADHRPTGRKLAKECLPL
jgi:hypothetical protein